MFNADKTIAAMDGSVDLGKILEWDKYRNEIPFINFPSNWKVRIVPPFLAAMIRFHVKEETEEKEDAFVSVYLDCHDILGIYGNPYWEVYPYHGDIARCDMNAVEELLENITEALDGLKNNEASHE